MISIMGSIKGLWEQIISLKNSSMTIGESPEDFLNRIKTQVLSLNTFVDFKENKQCQLCENRMMFESLIWYLVGMNRDLRTMVMDQMSDLIDVTPSTILDQVISCSMTNWRRPPDNDEKDVKRVMDKEMTSQEEYDNEENLTLKSEEEEDDTDYDPLLFENEEEEEEDYYDAEITTEDIKLLSQSNLKFDEEKRICKLNNLKPVINNQGVFQCYVCEKPFTTKDPLLEHIIQHYDESTTFCAHCDEPSTFEDNHECRENMSKSKKEKLIVKKRDPEELRIMTDLIKSLPQLKVETKMKFILKNVGTEYPRKTKLCKFCNKCFDHNPTALKRHLETVHKGQTKFKCQHCETEFTTRHKYLNHLENKHGIIIKTSRMKDFYYCTKCLIAFKTRAERILHHDRVHRLIYKKELPCQYCGKGFTHKRTLKEHELTHQEKKPQRKIEKCICSYCSKEFNSRHLLATHEIIHTKNYRFYCKSCGRGFPSSSSVNKHEVKCVRGDTFKCSQCEECFPSYVELFAHIKTHNLDNVEPKFECKCCDEKFQTRHKLLAHRQKKHSEFIKTFGCKSCPDKTYGNRVNAVQHVITTHSDLAPYQCQVCGIFKNFRNGLAQHIRNNHKDAPIKDRSIKCNFTPEYEEVLEKYLIITKEERKESSYLNFV